jgi:hypothetical protein
LVGGGTALVSEGHSLGGVGGDLRWFIIIWWDAQAKLYRFLTCFKTPADGGCELRGTAHWDGDALSTTTKKSSMENAPRFGSLDSDYS